MSNVGLYFYRTFFTDYFEHINDFPEESEKKFAEWLREKNEAILNSGFDPNSVEYFSIPYDQEPKNESSFSLKTRYPGLVSGVGYEHELGFANEFKLGFLFDHTTGLPYLPGSSIKGVIRHYFRMRDYMLELLKEIPVEIYQTNSTQAIDKEVFIELLSSIRWENLENSIFEGMDFQNQGLKSSSYQRDRFLDAFISGSDNKNGKILDDDYITSHQNREHPELSPFSNPNPVRFLKVSSNVTFTFQFRLVDTPISNSGWFTKKLKLELFKRILLDQGIGAKTNVGYGQFE